MTAVLATQRPAHAKAPTAPTAAVYCGTVRRRRSTPIINQFTHRMFLAYLDVDALPASLDRLPLWSARRTAPIRFRRHDFLDGGTNPLGDALRDIVESRLGRRPTGPVHLLAHLRTLGWLFNPLVVYYCWQPSGDALDAIVLEVTNTPWGERHHYVLDATQPEMRAHQPKALHVSPFLPTDMEYRITWTPPRENLLLRIEVARSGTVEFEAELSLRRAELDQRRAATILLRYPIMTLRVSISIYRQAFRLLRKGVPLYRHPQRHERGGRP